MPPRLEGEVSDTVWRALAQRQRQTGEPLDRIVDMLLSEGLDLEHHTLFQVSTSNALVQGVFEGNTTVGDLKTHGDFGLGTFAGLDGEMILIDGECFRATAGGVVEEVDDRYEVPFALVTHFVTDSEFEAESSPALQQLAVTLDSARPSANLFVGIAVDADFAELSLRSACRALPGEGLVEATAHQSEFRVTDVDGALVGFWAPEYAKAVSVPGYHFHFISNDRTIGGHVLGLQAESLRIRLHTESDLHLALPATAEFLSADLSGDHQSELSEAESERR